MGYCTRQMRVSGFGFGLRSSICYCHRSEEEKLRLLNVQRPEAQMHRG
jgi:hypothetical protein